MTIAIIAIVVIVIGIVIYSIYSRSRSSPTLSPTLSPTSSPTLSPTSSSSSPPASMPSSSPPASMPSSSPMPSLLPSASPASLSTVAPTLPATIGPSYQPTVISTTAPSPTPTPSTAIIPMVKQTTPFTDDVSGYWMLHIADNMHNLTDNEDIIILLQKYPPRDSNWPNYWASTQITGKGQRAKIPAIQANASSSFMMIHYFSPENTDQSISWVKNYKNGNDHKNYLNYGQYGGDIVYLKRVYSNDNGNKWSTYYDDV